MLRERSFGSLAGISAVIAFFVFSATCGLPTNGLGDTTTGAGGAGVSTGISASGGAAGTGGSASAEDCFNGADDNDDGKVDCADPLCEDAAVCDAVPAGWTLVRVMAADPTEPPGKCSDGSTGQLFFTGPAGAPECTACTCTPMGAICSAPVLKCWFDNDTCTGAHDAAGQAPEAKCYPLKISGAMPPGSCKLDGDATLKPPGTCPPTGGAMVSASMWSGGLLLCDQKPAVSGCEDGRACVSQSGTKTGEVCITRPGTDPCPSGWSSATTAFKSGTDNRSCSPCTCTTTTCKGGGYEMFSKKDCKTTDPHLSISSTTCTEVPYFTISEVSFVAILGTPAPSCSGGVGQGQVDAATPQQICCK